MGGRAEQSKAGGGPRGLKGWGVEQVTARSGVQRIYIGVPLPVEPARPTLPCVLLELQETAEENRQ